MEPHDQLVKSMGLCESDYSEDCFDFVVHDVNHVYLAFDD